MDPGDLGHLVPTLLDSLLIFRADPMSDFPRGIVKAVVRDSWYQGRESRFAAFTLSSWIACSKECLWEEKN